MNLKEILSKIDTLITSSGIIQSWGGYSIDMYDKANVTYGISQKNDCHGKAFGQNDTVSSGAYMWVDESGIKLRLQSRLYTEYMIPIKIEIFSTPKKLGQTMQYYDKMDEMVKLLVSNNYNVEINAVRTIGGNREHCTITINMKTFVGCGQKVYLPEMTC